MGWSQKERPFCKKTSEYSLSNLVFTYLHNGIFEKMMKIVSYFQFILIISHFEMILKESMIVKTNKISIAKSQRFLRAYWKSHQIDGFFVILEMRWDDAW